jgi:hypothetical protein
MTQDEAMGGLETTADSSIIYRSLTHTDILVQTEQLSSMDAIREGEATWTDDAYASVPGTVVGLWHALLQGARIITDPQRLAEGQIFLGSEPLARQLAALPDNVAPHHEADAARAFYCFDRSCAAISLSDAHALSQNWKLTVCPAYVHPDTDRIVSLSLPDSAPPTRTADAQTGHKLGSVGRLLPGYKFEKTDTDLHLTSPDGITLFLPESKLDTEDFLVLFS